MYSLSRILSTPIVAVLARLLFSVALLTGAASTSAAHHKTGHSTVWAIDNAASTLSFVSVKAGEIAEAHKFGTLSGELVVSGDTGEENSGDLNIEIDLASVNTNIAIRDERIREHLFETAEFPVAAVSGQIDVRDYLELVAGSSMKTSVTLVLDLHGAKVPFAAEVLVSRLSDSRLVVANLKSIVVTAGSVGLVAGIEKLRELAGLPSISGAVPATFVLTFDRQTKGKQ